MFNLPIPWKLLLGCSLAALTASTIHAQEAIRWRTDYASARKEAEAKNLPMLIDLLTDPCQFCIKMDQLTYPDARVVATINQRFIPLKINYREDRTLADKLNVGAFPTTVLAGPDGSILTIKTGFMPADDLYGLMQQALLRITPPDAMQEKYLAAEKQEKSGDFIRALGTLRDILDDGRGKPIQSRAQELLRIIEKRAEDRLAGAHELHTKGQNVEAIGVCTEVLRLFPGVPACQGAQELIASIARSDKTAIAVNRTKRARDMMAQAQEFYASKDYIPCLDRCRIIFANYADLPEGQQAYLLSGKIKNNQEWLKGAIDAGTDQLGDLWLALADSQLKSGDVVLAQHSLRRVIACFPGSRMAESAQIRLNQLQGTVPVRRDEVARP